MTSKMLLALCYFAIIVCCSYVESCSNNGTLYYFAYGSNLLAKRIHIKNPSAVFYGPAKLANYRLDFNIYSSAWRGAAATIIEDEGEQVWGALWTLDPSQTKYLDQQEGVDENMYFAKNVTVTTPDGTEIVARTYQETVDPPKLADGEVLPLNRRPSNSYLQVIALGAIESHLPAEYIGFIFSFPTNRQMATPERRNQLGYPF